MCTQIGIPCAQEEANILLAIMSLNVNVSTAACGLQGSHVYRCRGTSACDLPELFQAHRALQPSRDALTYVIDALLLKKAQNAFARASAAPQAMYPARLLPVSLSPKSRLVRANTYTRSKVKAKSKEERIRLFNDVRLHGHSVPLWCQYLC